MSMLQVIKLDNNGKVLMVLGKKFEPGKDDHHFCKPTKVAVHKTSSNFYVADG